MDRSYKRYFITLSIFITISTQSGDGTPLSLVVTFANYNTKRVTAITNMIVFILVPPLYISSISAWLQKGNVA